MIFIWCYWQACLMFTGRLSCSMRPVNAIQLILYQVHALSHCSVLCHLNFQLACIHFFLSTRRPSKSKTSQGKFNRSASVYELLHVICLSFYSKFRPYILDRLRLFFINKHWSIPVFNPHIALQAAYIFNPPNKRPVKPSPTKKPPVCTDGFVFQLI